MHPYPHHYTVNARSEPTGDVELAAANLPTLQTAPPLEFDGPGDRWSPETLLCAAVADCFVLSFRAVARASRLDWTSLECRVEGKLDKVDGKAQF
ncbi:MAG: OsmC family protein, partial [Steroidobacteraceae bacterium]